jgi:hypothetical protein
LAALGVAFSWRVVGLIAVATGLLAVVPATASAAPGGATMFVHSAKSGEFAAGGDAARRGPRAHLAHRWRPLRLGLGREATPPAVLARDAAATGTLHVAGHRRGDEPTFRLTRPRYNASRLPVSYGAPAMQAPLGGSLADGVRAEPERLQLGEVDEVVPALGDPRNRKLARGLVTKRPIYGRNVWNPLHAGQQAGAKRICG